MATAAPAIPQIAIGETVKIPAVGYGVGTAWFKAEGEKAEALQKSISDALDAGFRHLDCAECYQNDANTGKAVLAWLDKNGMKREDLHITDKVLSVDEGIEKICKKSLEVTGLQYFDLYLVHGPYMLDGTPFKKSLKEIWSEMEALYDSGLVKAIGVSNWRVSDLEEVWESARIKPVVNQCEIHPYLQQPKLIKWCEEHQIVMAAYSPLSSLTQDSLKGGPVDEVVAKVADRTGKSPTQVLLKMAYQLGYIVITTSSKPARMAECLSMFDFDLTAEEISAIQAAGASAPQIRFYWKMMPIDP